MLAPLSWVRPSEDLRNSSSYCIGALAEIQALAMARNAASWGLSSKFMVLFLGRCIRLVKDGVGAALLHNAASIVVTGVAALNPLYAVQTLRCIPLAHAIDQRVFPIRY